MPITISHCRNAFDSLYMPLYSFQYYYLYFMDSSALGLIGVLKLIFHLSHTHIHIKSNLPSIFFISNPVLIINIIRLLTLLLQSEDKQKLYGCPFSLDELYFYLFDHVLCSPFHPFINKYIHYEALHGSLHDMICLMR